MNKKRSWLIYALPARAIFLPQSKGIHFVCLLSTLLVSMTLFAQTPAAEVQLAHVYENENVQDYLVSKKYDGFRAIWKNKQLRTRNGHPINAPLWFTARLPDVWLDGELWYKVGEFEFVASTVSKHTPVDAQWRHITYQVFDAPNYTDPFSARAKRYTALLASANIPHVKAVEQHSISNNESLMQLLHEYTAAGGEGLMLQKSSAMFASGRSGNLLKLKKYRDAEAVVLKHLSGKGKYALSMGSMLVSHTNENGNEVRFKIGTGFSDEHRKNPPPIGSQITFAFHGYTNRGIPRFASFIRVKLTIETYLLN